MLPYGTPALTGKYGENAEAWKYKINKFSPSGHNFPLNPKLPVYLVRVELKIKTLLTRLSIRGTRTKGRPWKTNGNSRRIKPTVYTIIVDTENNTEKNWGEGRRSLKG